MSEEKELIEVMDALVDLRYNFSAGRAPTSFLKGMKKGKIIGHRSDVTGLVTVPPRGADPETGTATSQEVELPETATVLTFTVVHIPIPNAPVKPPFVVANMVLDDSDQAFIHLISEVPNEEVRIGMRVKALWKDESEWDYSFENIKYFVPAGEPDIAIADLKAKRLAETEKYRNA